MLLAKSSSKRLSIFTINEYYFPDFTFPANPLKLSTICFLQINILPNSSSTSQNMILSQFNFPQIVNPLFKIYIPWL